MTMRIGDKKTLVNIKQGRIEDEDADVIISWLNPDFRSGPQSFYHIHNKAGIQLFNAMLTYEVGVANKQPGDCFTTLPGQLNCKSVFHVIIPPLKGMLSKAFYNIGQTMITHKENALCRSLSIYIPAEAEICLKGIKDFLLDCGLDEVNVLYMTDKEKQVIEDYFKQFEYKPKLKERINSRMEGWVSKLGSKKLPAFLEKILWRKIEDYGKQQGADTAEEKELDSKPGN